MMGMNQELSPGVVWLQRCVVATALLFSTALGVQADEERSITVQATGFVMAVPDVARFDVGVTTQGETAVAAMRANAARADQILLMTTELGIPAADVRTTRVSLFPVFERSDGARDEPPRIVGYQASNSISVTLREIDKVGVALDRLVKAGVTDVGALAFQSSEIEVLEDEALMRAMARAQVKADRLSVAANVELGDVLSITEQVSGGPRPVVALRAVAESTVPIAPGQQRIEATVSVRYGLAN